MNKVPNIVKPPPGPKSKALLEARSEYVPTGVWLTSPVAIEESKNAVVKDVDGNIYIDFTSGIGVVSIGHCREEIVKTISDQAAKLIHNCIHVVNYEPYLKLAKRLTEITPGGFKKRAMMANSGAEAVENAVKIVRQKTGKPGIISFENSFHGRTYMAMSLTGKWDPYRVGFGPYVPGVYMTPFAYCYRCSFHEEYPDCGMACIHHLEKSILKTQVPPNEVGAMIAEPIQGEGGFIDPPIDFFKELKKLCEKHGIYLIIDEIQTGFARTGKFWAIEHYGVEPDVMVMAKAIASGLPLSAVVAKDELFKDTYPGSLGGTYGGNPVSCATALKVIEIIEREKVVDMSAKLGMKIRKRLDEWKEKYDVIGDVRGKGPMLAMEFVKDRTSKEPYPEATSKILKDGLSEGLLLLKAGLYNNCVRLHPPLTIEDEHIETGLSIIESSIKTIK